MSEQEETANKTLITEDRVNIRTYKYRHGCGIFYSADLEVNGREHSDVVSSEESALDPVKTLMTHIFKKAKALYYANDPKVADALADDIVRDAAELIATTRALADTVKGRKAQPISSAPCSPDS